MGALDGIKVVEFGAWVAGPSATALLADWGAEVWKVEPPKGDPFRGIVTSQGYSDEIPNAPFTVDNRGKRSVVLDLRTDVGVKAADLLLAGADVLVTNMRTKSLNKLGFGPDDVRRRHPHLVYCLITGYGSTGPDRDRAGYDIGAFAGRSGILHQMRPGDGPPAPLPLGFGDHVVGLAAASGVLGALLERHRTGEGQVVETSLLRCGTFAMGWELGVQLLLGRVPGGASRAHSKTPLVNCYRTADDQWFWLLGVEAERHFPPLIEALERPDLAADSRFITARDRRINSTDFIAALDAAFAEHPMNLWAKRFEQSRVWWAPVHTPAQVASDEQAQAAGCFVDIEPGDFRTVAGPVSFWDHPQTTRPAAPDLGADTDEVLRAVGCSDELLVETNRT